MIKLWLFFIILILSATFLFVYIYTGHEYECTLPGGGYLIIRWNENSQKIDLVKIERGKIKHPPQKTFKIHRKPASRP